MATKEELAREAWSSIVRLFISEERERAFERATATEGLTPRLAHALLDLSPDEPKPMRWLAERWFCDASNVTGVVDSLEERGLVQRETPRFDRRLKLIRMTKLGVHIRDRVIEKLSDPPEGLVDLPAADLRTLSDLLAKASARYPWPT